MSRWCVKKRSWLVLALPLLLLGAAPYKVQSMLQKSLHTEREAVAKYEACALKATEELSRGGGVVPRGGAGRRACTPSGSCRPCASEAFRFPSRSPVHLRSE